MILEFFLTLLVVIGLFAKGGKIDEWLRKRRRRRALPERTRLLIHAYTAPTDLVRAVFVRFVAELDGEDWTYREQLRKTWAA